MKILFILRHGDAIPRNENKLDKQRPLSKKGQKELKSLRKEEIDLFKSIDLVLCSSSVRTRETLECVMKGLLDRVTICYLDSLYDSNVETIIQEIGLVDDKFNTVMVIAHNPGLTNLTNQVCEHQELPMDKSMSTGSISEFVLKTDSWQSLKVSDLQFRRLLQAKK